jgi:hypothetical protein
LFEGLINQKKLITSPRKSTPGEPPAAGSHFADKNIGTIVFVDVGHNKAVRTVGRGINYCFFPQTPGIGHIPAKDSYTCFRHLGIRSYNIGFVFIPYRDRFVALPNLRKNGSLTELSFKI